MPVEYIVDLPANVGSQPEELSVDAMQDGFQEVSLSGVFTVKKLQKLKRNKMT